MIQKDYILRLLQQLIDSLFMLLDKKDLDNGELKNQLNKFYLDYLDKPQDFYLDMDLDEIVKHLEQHYGVGEYLYRIEMLSEIMYQDGMLERDDESKRAKLLKTLQILYYLKEFSTQYSLIREGKIDAVKSILA